MKTKLSLPRPKEHETEALTGYRMCLVLDAGPYQVTQSPTHDVTFWSHLLTMIGPLQLALAPFLASMARSDFEGYSR